MPESWKAKKERRRKAHPIGVCVGPPKCNREHGNRTHYIAGCRCVKCSAASTEYMKADYDRRKADSDQAEA